MNTLEVTVNRFEKEGPNHALLLLCQEHLLHNKYAKG